MDLLEKFRNDVRVGMELEKKRKAEKRAALERKKKMQPPRKPRMPNKALIQIGIWAEQLRPLLPVYRTLRRYAGELKSFMIRDLKKVYERGRSRLLSK